MVHDHPPTASPALIVAYTGQGDGQVDHAYLSPYWDKPNSLRKTRRKQCLKIETITYLTLTGAVSLELTQVPRGSMRGVGFHLLPHQARSITNSTFGVRLRGFRQHQILFVLFRCTLLLQYLLQAAFMIDKIFLRLPYFSPVPYSNRFEYNKHFSSTVGIWILLSSPRIGLGT